MAVTSKSMKMKKRFAPKRFAKRMPTKTGQATCPSKSPAPSWMLLAAFTILILLAATLIYQYLVVARRPEGFKSKSGKKNESFDVPSGSPSESKEKEKAKATLVFLHMNGCGWCEKFKPEWDAFSSSYQSSLATNGVELASYERSSSKAKAYESYAEGYPTILLDKSGDVKVFKGDRTPQGLADFLNSNGFKVSPA